MRSYTERFQRGNGEKGRERETGMERRERERGKIIKRESAKNDLPATRWNNFPANTVATFKRHCMHRFLRRNGENEAETKRERRERKSSIYFRGEKRRRKSEGKKDLLSLSRKSLFFPRLYTVFTYVNARNGGRKSGTTSFAFVPTIILMNYRRPLSRLILPSNSHRNSTLSLSLSLLVLNAIVF